MRSNAKGAENMRLERLHGPKPLIFHCGCVSFYVLLRTIAYFYCVETFSPIFSASSLEVGKTRKTSGDSSVLCGA